MVSQQETASAGGLLDTYLIAINFIVINFIVNSSGLGVKYRHEQSDFIKTQRPIQ